MLGFLGSLALELGESVISVGAGVIAWAIGLLADAILVLSAALPAGIGELPEIAGVWETGLSFLNFWVPVGQIGALLATWVAATLAYYAFQFILRHAIINKM